jgi:hypothetical protein
VSETSSETDSLLKALDAHIRAVVVDEIEKRMPAPGGEWLTIKEAIEQASLSEWHVRKLVRNGSVQFYQPNPGKPPLRINRRSLLDLMSQMKGSKK